MYLHSSAQYSTLYTPTVKYTCTLCMYRFDINFIYIHKKKGGNDMHMFNNKINLYNKNLNTQLLYLFVEKNNDKSI